MIHSGETMTRNWLDDLDVIFHRLPCPSPHDLASKSVRQGIHDHFAPGSGDSQRSVLTSDLLDEAAEDGASDLFDDDDFDHSSEASAPISVHSSARSARSARSAPAATRRKGASPPPRIARAQSLSDASTVPQREAARSKRQRTALGYGEELPPLRDAAGHSGVHSGAGPSFRWTGCSTA